MLQMINRRASDDDDCDGGFDARGVGNGGRHVAHGDGFDGWYGAIDVRLGARDGYGDVQQWCVVAWLRFQ